MLPQYMPEELNGMAMFPGGQAPVSAGSSSSQPPAKNVRESNLGAFASASATTTTPTATATITAISSDVSSPSVCPGLAAIVHTKGFAAGCVDPLGSANRSLLAVAYQRAS